MMKSKVDTILKENRSLKTELESLVNLIKENETKHKGFRLIEDAFLLADSIEEMDSKALVYMEEVFGLDRAVLFVDSEAIQIEMPPTDICKRIIFTDEKILRYAYVDKRPYFGTYLEGLISDFHITPEIASYLIAPVMENGKIIGSINLYSSDPQKLSGEVHSDFVRELALRVAISLRKLHNLHTIRYQAQRDYLTNIYNKGMMNTLITRYMERHQTNYKGFTFILLDIDNFKNFNNTHGHMSGDFFLKELATGIGEIIDESGALGRFGGDEFYILLDTVSPLEVRSFCNKVSFLIKETAGKYGPHQDTGISGGFLCVPSDMPLTGDHENNALEIVRRADSALYESKNAGKGIFTQHKKA